MWLDIKISHAVNKSCCHREVTPDSKFPAFAVTKAILCNSDKYFPTFLLIMNICTWVRKNGKCIIWGSIWFTYQKVTTSSHKGFCKEHIHIIHSPIWCCNPPKQLFQGHMVSHTIIKFQQFRWTPFIWLSLTAMTGFMISYQIYHNYEATSSNPHTKLLVREHKSHCRFREISRSAPVLTAVFTRAAT